MLNIQEIDELKSIIEKIEIAKKEKTEEITVLVTYFSTEMWEVLSRKNYEVSFILDKIEGLKVNIKWGSRSSNVIQKGGKLNENNEFE